MYCDSGRPNPHGPEKTTTGSLPVRVLPIVPLAVDAKAAAVGLVRSCASSSGGARGEANKKDTYSRGC